MLSDALFIPTTAHLWQCFFKFKDSNKNSSEPVTQAISTWVLASSKPKSDIPSVWDAHLKCWSHCGWQFRSSLVTDWPEKVQPNNFHRTLESVEQSSCWIANLQVNASYKDDFIFTLMIFLIMKFKNLFCLILFCSGIKIESLIRNKVFVIDKIGSNTM